MAPERTNEELVALSEHVLFEVRLFFELEAKIRGIVEGETEEPAWAVKQALLGSFALQARSLMDFLWDTGRRRPDDGRAADFFAAGVWEGLRPPQEATLADVRERASREIAHITYHRTRVDPGEKGWPAPAIAGAIGRCLRVFLDHLPAERAVPQFERDIRATWPEYLNYPAAVSLPAPWSRTAMLAAATSYQAPRRSA